MRIEVWGRGGEIVLGSIDTEKYTYWALKSDADAVESEINGWDEESEVPEELRLGNWFDIDNIAHENGPSYEEGGISVYINDELVFEKEFHKMTELDGCEDLVENMEEYYFSETSHKHGFWAYDYQKGHFETYETADTTFDPKLLKISIADVEGVEIVSSIKYNGTILDGTGDMSTDGKSFDYGFLTNE